MENQLRDVTIVVSEVALADDEAKTPYTFSRIIRLDWTGNAEDLVKLLESSMHCRFVTTS